jgi:hypothetical protein
MTHKKCQSLYLPVFILLLIAHLVIAGTTGKLVGIVLDKSTSEVLPGVNIIIDNTVLGAATDLDGSFLILGIPPGIYTVRAMMIGYVDMVQTGVVVNVDKTTHLEFRLSQTSLELGETIEVTAERPLVKRDLTSTESSVGREAIESLPVDNFQDVVNLQAGVIDGHFRGGRTGEVAYLINGIPINDVYSGDIAVEIENNSIQELNVISGTFNAEYGQAMSGVVNIVTKEGSSVYTGGIRAYGGSYFSPHDNIFWNDGNINPIIDIQGDLSGALPGFKRKLTFFLSGRLYQDEGYIYGKDVFSPSDVSYFTPENPAERIIQSHGVYYPFTEETAQQLIDEADEVPLKDWDRYTGSVKLTYQLTNRDKISTEAILQQRYWHEYSHEFRLNPAGIIFSASGPFWMFAILIFIPALINMSMKIPLIPVMFLQSACRGQVPMLFTAVDRKCGILLEQPAPIWPNWILPVKLIMLTKLKVVWNSRSIVSGCTNSMWYRNLLNASHRPLPLAIMNICIILLNFRPSCRIRWNLSSWWSMLAFALIISNLMVNFSPIILPLIPQRELRLKPNGK